MEHTFTKIKKVVSGQDVETVVKRVEFTYEMSWKAIKRYLGYISIGCAGTSVCFKD